METKKKYPARLVCDLPVDVVNKVLGLELDPGEVWVSRACHKHIAEDHPDAYAACYHQLDIVISDPSFLGQSPKHNDAIEVIRRLVIGQNQAIVLAAVSMETNQYRNYNVRSVYLIEQDDLDMRRRANRIISVI